MYPGDRGGHCSIKISRSVRGYQECRFSVDVGEEFLIRRLAPEEERLKSLTLDGSLILFSKIDVGFCSIAEPNRTPIVRLTSIGFLFD